MKTLALLLTLVLALASPSWAAPYALIDASGAVRETREFAATPPDLLATEGVRWLPVIITDPAFDPATQVRTGPVETILANSVTRVWTVRAKTAPELDDDKVAQVDALGEVVTKALLDHENRVRNSFGLAPVTEADLKTTLKGYIGANPPAPDPTHVALKKCSACPAQIIQFTASITIGAVSAATYTDKTFSVPGLLTTDTIVSVRFTAGLTPATISYTPLRVSAADTLALRFEKISTGAVTPPAPQAITVLVAR